MKCLPILLLSFCSSCVSPQKANYSIQVSTVTKLHLGQAFLDIILPPKEVPIYDFPVINTLMIGEEFTLPNAMQKLVCGSKAPKITETQTTELISSEFSQIHDDSQMASIIQSIENTMFLRNRAGISVASDKISRTQPVDAEPVIVPTKTITQLPTASDSMPPLTANTYYIDVS